MTILATIVLLGVLIFVHELGHFWAAKSVGIAVERFSIGLGPRIWGYTRGGTEYVLSLIPLGGYVKMQGMDDEVMEHLEGGATQTHRSRHDLKRSSAQDFDSKSVLARAFVISAGVIMNMIFAFILFTAIYMGRGVPEPATTRVMAVAEARLPPGTEALAGIESGAVVVRVGDVEPETWEQMIRAFHGRPGEQLDVVTEEPAGSFTVTLPEGTQELAELTSAIEVWVDPLEPVIGTVEPGSPADDVLESGDRITTVAGVPIASWDDMTREVSARPGERVDIGVRRGDDDLVRTIVLKDVAADDSGPRRGMLGVRSVEAVFVPVGFLQAVKLGAAQTESYTRTILGFLRSLFTGGVSPREVGSIGTIAVMSGEAAEDGWAAYLYFMAIFSINLAILNMLPIPILDGGHMVFLGLEAIRGRRLSVKQRLFWSKVGMMALVLIMVWALSNDVLRFIGL